MFQQEFDKIYEKYYDQNKKYNDGHDIKWISSLNNLNNNVSFNYLMRAKITMISSKKNMKSMA